MFSFLERLSIARKLSLLGLMVAFTVAVPLYLQVRQSNELLSAANAESDGVEPARRLMKLVQLTQQHRGLAAGFLGGNDSVKAARETRRHDVDVAITALEAAVQDKGYSPAFGEALKSATAAWRSLGAQVDGKQLKAGESSTLHAQVIAQYFRVLDLLLDDSGLILDPESGTYYLVAASLTRLPPATEALGQTRARGAGFLAEGSIDADGRAVVAGSARGAREHLDAMTLGFAKATASDDAIKAALAAPMAAARSPIDEALRLASSEVVKADALTYPAPKYIASFTTAIDTLFVVEDTALGELDRLLKERISGLRRMQVVQFGMLGLLLVGVAFMARVIVRSITVPLGQAVDLAERVAAGDLTVDATVRGRDEVARLLGSLRTMKDSLHRVVGEVRSNADGVALASREIAQGNADLSRRTEQQAASLEETASSMEELSSTVRQNADHAGAANRLAQDARELAQRGGDSVQRMVETMQGIDAGSRRIADIIGVIDGIAFQTNILALNAAVEAARAGEQGRGFAVVAGEVRTLAQRSAEAAREIKGLITASQQQVAQGTAAVQRTGSEIGATVGAIHQVAEAIALISHASSEQSAGVGQISTAVADMDRMTQQNASLVEQAAAAAESLDTQARSLVTLMARFRLTREEAALAA